MYYILYLSSLCQRRRWPDPHYEFTPVATNTYDRYGPVKGYTCSVRVNHRVYKISTVHETEELAREAAAMHAYYICRNLSVAEQTNDLPPLAISAPMAHQPVAHGSVGNGMGYYQPQHAHATTGGGWGGRRNS